MLSIGVTICGFILCGISGVCVGYVFGLDRGMRPQESGSVIPSVPLLRSFGRRERRRPVSISEFEQARREPKDPPADPS